MTLTGNNKNTCNSEEHPITNTEIFSSLVSNANDGENNNDVAEENNNITSRQTTKKLEEAIAAILKTALYSSEHGLEMRNLELKTENAFLKARIFLSFSICQTPDTWNLFFLEL